MRKPKGKKIVGKHSEARTLEHLKGRFKYGTYALLEEELSKLSAKAQAETLSIEKNSPLKHAASTGDADAIQFIVNSMPEEFKSKLLPALVCSNAHVARSFVAKLTKNKTSQPDGDMLTKGIKALASINIELATPLFTEIANEYGGETKTIILAALDQAGDSLEAEPAVAFMALGPSGLGHPGFFPSHNQFDPHDHDDANDGSDGWGGSAGCQPVGETNTTNGDWAA